MVQAEQSCETKDMNEGNGVKFLYNVPGEK